MKREAAWQNKTAWKLYKSNWELCKKIVEKRDGYTCQIPNCSESQHLQLDHVFSRAVKTLFFDTDNLGYLCGPHHQHKSFRHGQWVDMMVKEICKKRAGEEWWDYALIVSRNQCPKFRQVSYQEQVKAMLEKQLKISKATLKEIGEA